MKNTPTRKELVRVIKHLRQFGIKNCHIKRSNDYVNVLCSNNQDSEHIYVNESGIGVSDLKKWINSLPDTLNHYVMVDAYSNEDSVGALIRCVHHRPISDAEWLNNLAVEYFDVLNCDNPLLAKINKTICSILHYNKFQLATAIQDVVNQHYKK